MVSRNGAIRPPQGGIMTRRNRRDGLETWVARRLHRAAGDLSLAIGDLDELVFEARRPELAEHPRCARHSKL